MPLRLTFQSGEGGSIPTRSLQNTVEIEQFGICRTDFAQNPAPQDEIPGQNQASEEGSRPLRQESGYYQLAYTPMDGKRRLQSFSTYAQAKAEAERIVRELATGSQASALTKSQSRDAVAATPR